jgi:hypothetical protein
MSNCAAVKRGPQDLTVTFLSPCTDDPPRATPYLRTCTEGRFNPQQLLSCNHLKPSPGPQHMSHCAHVQRAPISHHTPYCAHIQLLRAPQHMSHCAHVLRAPRSHHTLYCAHEKSLPGPPRTSYCTCVAKAPGAHQFRYCALVLIVPRTSAHVLLHRVTESRRSSPLPVRCPCSGCPQGLNTCLNAPA